MKELKMETRKSKDIMKRAKTSTAQKYQKEEMIDLSSESDS